MDVAEVDAQQRQQEQQECLIVGLLVVIFIKFILNLIFISVANDDIFSASGNDEREIPDDSGSEANAATTAPRGGIKLSSLKFDDPSSVGRGKGNGRPSRASKWCGPSGRSRLQSETQATSEIGKIVLVIIFNFEYFSSKGRETYWTP